MLRSDLASLAIGQPVIIECDNPVSKRVSLYEMARKLGVTVQVRVIGNKIGRAHV